MQNGACKYVVYKNSKSCWNSTACVFDVTNHRSAAPPGLVQIGVHTQLPCREPKGRKEEEAERREGTASPPWTPPFPWAGQRHSCREAERLAYGKRGGGQLSSPFDHSQLPGWLNQHQTTRRQFYSVIYQCMARAEPAMHVQSRGSAPETCQPFVQSHHSTISRELSGYPED